VLADYKSKLIHKQKLVKWLKLKRRSYI